ncbi:MAG: VOC family protein [Paucimonas sp.]|jgi:catechol 2,3-dioxygenase-like lactoylglutathione lyase family enzyme|uniref:glyoxalase superfamily protein n=1 Tax=Pantoea sp. Cy-639 TaxID=2608360 RepID=UPI001421782D|nr:glyoxalase superfamily protein [Pantoea sp. Cy-639]MDR2307897.1 VOC family protein [Paucimonas sp.]NIF18724.1 VOC family protein [Pantoea sp. Cy-639]
MQLSPAIPILRIFSVDKAREFYLDFLGFQVDWEHRFAPDLPLYLQIHRDDLVLHLSEHHGDATPGAALFIRVDDLKTLEAELLAKCYGYARPQAETVDWGLELQVTDPFGNRLRFCQQIDGDA